MRNNFDPLVPHQRRKAERETPDEAEQRLNADLRALMNDERYRKNDGDYRHYVQRQYRRVYDDPTGERPKHLTIGRPRTYASDLEPFDRRREKLLRRQTEAGESGGGKARPVLAERSPTNDGRIRRLQNTPGGSGTGAEEEHDIPPYWDRAIGKFDPEPRRRSTPFPGIRDVEDEGAQQRYREHLHELKERESEIADARRRSWVFRNIAGGVGYDESVRAYEHYLEGNGEPLIVDAAIVEGYEPVENAQPAILQHLSDWLEGRLPDSRFGQPWLGLADGERVTIGEESFDADRVGKLIQWEALFEGPGPWYRDLDAWTESRATFNAGTLESFSQVTLERHGGRIDISGVVKFRVSDRYDFEDGHILKAKVLEDHEGAKSFDISTTFWDRPISGWMDISGSPDPRVHLTFDD